MFFCFAGGLLQWIMAGINLFWLYPHNVILFTICMSTGWILIGMGFIISEIHRRNK